MSKVWLHRGVYLLLLALGVGLTIWVFSDQDLNLLGKILWNTRWEWVLFSLIATVFGHWVRARRWALLLRGSGEAPKTKETFVALMTGYFVNLGVPRLGEATRCLSLNRLTGIPVMTSAGTVLVERLVDMICLFLIVVGTAFAARGEVESFFRGQIWEPMLGKVEGKELFLVVGGVALLLMATGLYFFLRMKLGKKWLEWIQKQAAKMRDGLLAIFYMPGKLRFLFYTFFIWISYFSAPFFSLYALGLNNDKAILVGFVVFVVGSVARTLPVPAGGLGPYHWFVVQAMLVMGFSSEEGLSLATLNFTVQTLFYVLFGILAFILLGIWGRKRI